MRGKIVQKHELLLNRIFPARGARTDFSFRVKTARLECPAAPAGPSDRRSQVFFRVAACGERNGELRASAGGGCGPPDSSSRRYFEVEAANKRRCASTPQEWAGRSPRQRRPASSLRWLRPAFGVEAASKTPNGCAAPARTQWSVARDCGRRRGWRRPPGSSSRRCCVFCRLPLSSA